MLCTPTPTSELIQKRNIDQQKLCLKLRKRFVHTTRSLSLSELIRKKNVKILHQIKKGRKWLLETSLQSGTIVPAAALERRVEIFTNWRLGIKLKITNKKYSVILYDSGVCRQSNVIVINIKVNQNGRRERGPKILPRIIRFFNQISIIFVFFFLDTCFSLITSLSPCTCVCALALFLLRNLSVFIISTCVRVGYTFICLWKLNSYKKIFLILWRGK